MDVVVTCEPPSGSLYSFVGKLRVGTDATEVPLNAENLLLRGAACLGAA